MKLPLLLLLCVLFLTKDSNAHKWVYVASNADSSMLYYIDSNGTSRGDIKDVWVKYASAHTRHTMKLNEKIVEIVIDKYNVCHQLYDCQNKKSMLLRTEDYDAVGKRLKIFDFDKATLEWTTFSSDSIGMGLLDIACIWFR